jgi:hypothetical protein
MASQTKVERAASSPVELASGVGAATGSSQPEPTLGDGAAEPASHVEAMVASDDGQPGDDEDVSLDELMMSGEDDDEPDEATDVQGLVVRPPVAAVPEAPEPEATLPGVRDAADDELDSAPGFGVASLEDDEAAALAAAAAAQEAAAQAAEAEARQAAELVARSARESVPPPVAAAEQDFELPVPEAPAAEAPADVLTEANSADDDADDAEPPMSVDLEPPASERAPEAVGYAPLPSFDIPEPEAPVAAAPAAEILSRHTPRPMAALPQLSEVGEDDDDDAVTHIGLPVVPEAPADYAGVGATAFSVAEPGVAPLTGFEPDLSLTDARRATTRVVPRIDPAELERRRLANEAAAASSRAPRRGPLGAWLSGVFQRHRQEPQRAGTQPAPSGVATAPPPRRAGWVDTILPPLSLVLFGSGIGAGIMLLQPDRGAKAAQQVQTVQALREAQKRPTTLAERAEAGDGDALFKITNMAPNERSSALTLALERGYQTQRQNEFKEFARTLETPAGLAAPNLTTRFLSYATSPETMLAAFSHLSSWPGSTGPDVLYNVWEKAPGGSRAASLAQQLLHSEDQRGKATPALLTALDLRTATSCEDYLRVLPAVQKSGDQRCSATLRALRHKDGCGDDGKQDCFACLREGSMLEDALTAIEGRPAPQP